MKKVYPSILLCNLSIFISGQVVAEEEKNIDSSIGFTLTVDNEKNRDSLLSFTHFVDEVHQLSMLVGKSYIQGDQSLGISDYTSRSVNIAIENFGDTLVNTGWEYEESGNSDELLIHSLRAMVALNGKNVRAELHPQFQRIRFENIDVPIVALTSIEFNSIGTGLNLSFTLSPTWNLALEYFENTYYRPLPNAKTAIDNSECKLRYSTHLSSTANSLASTLDENRKGATLTWQHQSVSIGVYRQSAKGYISGCDTDQNGIQVSVDLSGNWGLNFSAGNSSSPISERVSFASLGLIYRF